MSDQAQEKPSVDAETPKTPEQFADVQASRDKAKTRLKEAEASFAAQGEELAKLRAQSDERATVDAEAKLKADTDAGEWQSVISTKDLRIEALQKEGVEQAAKLASMVAQQRQNVLVDAIATEVPGANKFLIGATIRELGAVHGIDTAPETVSDDLKAVIVAKLKESAPLMFAAPAQTPPPTAGAGIQTPPSNDVSQWVDAMKRHTGAS